VGEKTSLSRLWILWIVTAFVASAGNRIGGFDGGIFGILAVCVRKRAAKVCTDRTLYPEKQVAKYETDVN
jgi:hypothetical protein